MPVDSGGMTEPERSRGSATEHFRRLAQHSPDLVAIFGADGRFAFVSDAHERVLGYSADELVGRLPLDLVHPDDVDRVLTEFSAQLTSGEPTRPVDFRFRTADGSHRHLEAVAVDLGDEPAVGGMLVMSRDVSDRRRAELVVQAQAAILERIARAAPLAETLDDVCAMVEDQVPGALVAVLLVDGTRLRVAAAPNAVREVLDLVDGAYAPPDVGAALDEGIVVAAIEPNEWDPHIAPGFEAAGYSTWWGAPVRSSDGDGLIGALMVLLPDARSPDAVERQLLASAGSLAAIAVERDGAQARLAHQASHDALTGLPNREHLVGRLHAVTDAPGTAAVFFLDLDRFKVFNDSVGHSVGDRILREVADRLRATLRDRDAVARFGGDEFVVVCTGLTDAEEVTAVGRRLLDVIAQPCDVDGMQIVITASIGVALVDGGSPETLLRDADAAMYRAKERGRARMEVFDHELRARVVRRLETEGDLRAALEREQLTVHYQPVTSLAAGRLAGFEALVRWEHPGRGLLRPRDFLGVAEETGLIMVLGAYVRERALAQWADWHARFPEWSDFVIGVNLAASELRDRTLPAQVADLIARHGIDPRLLVLEVSEEVVAADTEETRGVLGELHDLGVLVALDDFGTGSSPLLHLRRFPIDAIKLDGALVAGLGVDPDDDVMVAGVIRLAHDLGLFVVAEGIERDAQADRLREAGCLLGQGHAIAPPMAAGEAERWAVDYCDRRPRPAPRWTLPRRSPGRPR